MQVNDNVKVNYFRFPGFENIYLEDSYVLNILFLENKIQFELELVLTKEHPLYHAPYCGEQYCYQKAILEFPDVFSADWINKKMHPIQDATGKIDYGNIDGFYLKDNTYHIFGDWGYLIICSSEPIVRMNEIGKRR